MRASACIEMLANSVTHIPGSVDSGAVWHAVNAVRKHDILRVALTPKGEEIVAIQRGGQIIQHNALDQALLWFDSASEMLDIMCTLGCACIMTHRQPVDWI